MTPSKHQRRVLVSSDEAEIATSQHRRPCSDCPWRRDSVPGWLGGLPPQTWVKAAHGDERIECHTRIGAQCAGSSIYRRNVCKMARDPEALRLEADREKVFSSPTQFLEHHS